MGLQAMPDVTLGLLLFASWFFAVSAIVILSRLAAARAAQRWVRKNSHE